MLRLCVAAVAGCTWLAGCSALTVPDAPAVSSPIAPVWDESEIRDHIAFLQSDAVRGRADATLGYSIAAAYVAERLQEYRLQPALESDFRILHHAARNVVSGARLRFAGSDTVDFVLGRDYLPDGRSSQFDGSVRTIWIGDVPDGAATTAAALLRYGEPDPADAGKVQRGDVDVLLVQGPLVPRRSTIRWPGRAILEITPDAARRVLAQTRTDPEAPGRRVLDRPLRVEVAASWSRLAAGINVVGYVPGKHPRLATEAVLVCTHLDATGTFAGVPVLDLGNLGTEVAATLEVARQLSRFSRFTRIPERTLIVAFVSGGTVDSAGLESLLQSPVWERDRVRSVVYVGDAPRLEDVVPPTLPLTQIRKRPTAAVPDTLVLLPSDRGTSRSSVARTASEYMQPATDAAVELASRLYILLASELMGDEPTPAAQEL